MKDIRQLLIDFNKIGYSNPDAKYIDNTKGGLVLTLKIGEYVYEDEFYGGEPYSGNETIWRNNIPVFRSVYYGSILSTISKDVYSQVLPFLKIAISQPFSDKDIYRGPSKFILDDWEYQNRLSGKINKFNLTEQILHKKNLVYSAEFMGGLINLSAD